MVIYGFNFSLKMQFKIVSRRKKMEFFPTAPFFLVLCMIAYQEALIQRQLPCLEKFLVRPLGWLLLLISFALVNIYLYIQQKQLSSHTKLRKNAPAFRILVLLLLLLLFLHFKNQTTQRTNGDLEFIV